MRFVLWHQPPAQARAPHAQPASQGTSASTTLMAFCRCWKTHNCLWVSAHGAVFPHLLHHLPRDVTLFDSLLSGTVLLLVKTTQSSSFCTIHLFLIWTYLLKSEATEKGSYSSKKRYQQLKGKLIQAQGRHLQRMHLLFSKLSSTLCSVRCGIFYLLRYLTNCVLKMLLSFHWLQEEHKMANSDVNV